MAEEIDRLKELAESYSTQLAVVTEQTLQLYDLLSYEQEQKSLLEEELSSVKSDNARLLLENERLTLTLTTVESRHQEALQAKQDR